MLGRLAAAHKYHRNIPAVALRQNGVAVNIHFAKGSGKFRQQGLDGGLGGFAKMAAGTLVEGNFQGLRGGQPQVFLIVPDLDDRDAGVARARRRLAGGGAGHQRASPSPAAPAVAASRGLCAITDSGR